MSNYQTSAPGKKPDMRTKGARDAFSRCLERWQYINDVDDDNRKRAREDTEFVWIKGKQWPDRIRLARDADERPWLEINQMPQFVNMVVNDQRQNRPAIKIRPADDDATKEVAEIIEGHTRHIEYDSKAEAVYDCGFEHAVTSGRGYWRICTDYESPTSFDQKISIVRIPDPLSVYLDPDYQMPDASDIEYGFISELIGDDEFKRRWPKAQPLDFEGDDKQAITERWIGGENKVVIADYFEKVHKPRNIAMLSDGSIAWTDELQADPPLPLDPLLPVNAMAEPQPEPSETYNGGRIILQERETDDVSVKWYKVYGGGILEEYDWAGKYIPIVMCVGVETVIDGKRTYQGLIRRARDVQTMFNFWQTKATESLALAPNAQWLVPEGAVNGFETVWNTANLRYRTRLPYHADPSRPAPQRIDPPAPPSGVLEQANQCRQDFYTTIGIYPPNLAQESKVEVSGIAYNARAKQGDRSTFHFVDNLSRAIAHTGCIIVDLLPKIADLERRLPTVDRDGKSNVVTVNRMNPVAPGGPKENDLARGAYSVVVDVGPSYATRRMEAAESMLEFMQAYPAAAPLLGDLLAKNQDWADADIIASRLKIMLPPQIQMMEAQAGGDPKYAALLSALQQLQAQSQGSIRELQQQLQFAGQQVQKLQSEVWSTKAQAAQGKIAAARASLGAIASQHNAEIRAAAEHERTDIDAFRANTERIGQAVELLLGLIDAQQKQMQPVGAELQQLRPDAESVVNGTVQ